MDTAADLAHSDGYKSHVHPCAHSRTHAHTRTCAYSRQASVSAASTHPSLFPHGSSECGKGGGEAWGGHDSEVSFAGICDLKLEVGVGPLLVNSFLIFVG